MNTYIKQNRIQKEALSYIDLFRKDYNTIRSLEKKGISVYDPKRNKVKLSFIGLLIVGCVITPFTNFFILPLIKWGLK